MAIKTRYHIKNKQNTYDAVHFETSADQVITNDEKQFVSSQEKTQWNEKADTSFVNQELIKKANVDHSHSEYANTNHSHDTYALKNGDTLQDFNAKKLIVSESILPSKDGLNIGSETQRFSGIYVDEAYLSTNTLYIGDTPILGTNQDTIMIKADPDQSITMQTKNSGTTKILSETGVELAASGTNTSVNIKSTGANSQVNIAAANVINMSATDIKMNGDVNVSGTTTTTDLTVKGNLNVLGSTTTIDTQTLQVKDNIIDINKGETGSGVTAGKAGIRVLRGDAATYNILFDETDDMFKVGMDGQLETIATQPYVSQELTKKANSVHTHQASQVTFTDGKTFQEKLNDGSLKGPKGDTGAQGPQGIQGNTGAKGDTGATWRPSIDTSGNLTWTQNSGTTAPSSVNIKGPKGDKGDTGAQGIQGPQGATGAKGSTGVSMRLKGAWSSSVAYVNDSSYIDLVTSGGNTYACKVSHTNQAVSNTTYWELIAQKGDKGATGAQGSKGDTGAQGPQGIQGATGAKGDTGATWRPSVDSSGNLTWTQSSSTTSPTAVNIKGPQGATGAQGPKGDTGATGATGPQGPAGANGVTPTIKAGTVTTGAAGSSAAVTASTSGTTTTFNFTIPQGLKGDKGDTGAKGADGLTTSVTVGSTKYTHVSGNITIPAYPTLSSLGAAASSHTHNYAGSSSAGGAATTALACTGNSATATKLATARTINGVSFDGTSNITITAAANGGTSAACSGNSATATKWASARTITLSGAVTGSASIDGSANVTIKTTDAMPVTTITKSLAVTTSWADTGITGTNLATGSYMVQMLINDGTNTGQYYEYYTGTMSWYSGTTSSTDSDEILLHKAGHASGGRMVYLRTIRTASSGYLKLQIASSTNFKAASSITFKFRRLI